MWPTQTLSILASYPGSSPAEKRGLHRAAAPRTYVVDPDHGVPFLSSSTMLHADFTHAELLKKSDATSPQLAHLRIEEGTTLVSRSGTIGRMVYMRPEMSGMWASEHAIKIVPDPALVRPEYLHAFLSGRFGLPLVTGGTYGATVQHIEPWHVARVPVPLAPDDIQEQAHRLVTEAAARTPRPVSPPAPVMARPLQRRRPRDPALRPSPFLRTGPCRPRCRACRKCRAGPAYRRPRI